MEYDPYIYFFYILGSISVISSILVFISVIKFGAKTSSARLVLYLHITQIIEGLTCFPYLFPTDWCLYIVLIRNYSVIANLFIGLLMYILTYLILFKDTSGIDIKNRYQLHIYWERLLWIAPLISLFEFHVGTFNNGFGFCQSDYGDHILFIYIPVGLLLFFSILSITSILYKLRNASKEMKSLFYTGIGAYAFITVFLWVNLTLFFKIYMINDFYIFFYLFLYIGT